MNDDLKNRQIQAEAAATPGASAAGVENMGKVREDLWFAQRDRELIEQMRAGHCGQSCQSDKSGCRSDCQNDSQGACEKDKGACEKDKGGCEKDKGGCKGNC